MVRRSSILKTVSNQTPTPTIPFSPPLRLLVIGSVLREPNRPFNLLRWWTLLQRQHQHRHWLHVLLVVLLFHHPMAVPSLQRKELTPPGSPRHLPFLLVVVVEINFFKPINCLFNKKDSFKRENHEDGKGRELKDKKRERI